MARSSVEKRLSDVGVRLTGLREDLRIASEQQSHLSDEADETRLRAIVADSALAGREHRAAQRHADAMARHRADVTAQIECLERMQDELLDELLARDRGAS